MDSSLFRAKSNSESTLSVATSIHGPESDIFYIFVFGEQYIAIQNNTKELKIYPPCQSDYLSKGNLVQLLTETDWDIDTLRAALEGKDYNWDIVTTEKHHDMAFEFINDEMENTFIVQFGPGRRCKYNAAVSANKDVNMFMIPDWSHINTEIIPKFIINGYEHFAMSLCIHPMCWYNALKMYII